MRYGVQGSGTTQIVNISGGATTEATISGLTPSTSYSLAVAAVNSAGIGVYTDLLNVTTDSKYNHYTMLDVTNMNNYILRIVS